MNNDIILNEKSNYTKFEVYSPDMSETLTLDLQDEQDMILLRELVLLDYQVDILSLEKALENVPD